ncbi:MAG TPA: hypothetical protein VFP84_22840 [Kofleriaceae bacterium]|nr:hypothetical protein [Kofleriaceae bacterium]
MVATPCRDCAKHPVMTCGRCNTTRCRAHALAAGQRCDRCEQDWRDEAVTRRAAKMIFAPPVAILTGGLLFGVLLPVSIGGAVGAAILCALACATAAASANGACRLVDRSARALFLRERAGGLPAARLLAGGRRPRLLPAPDRR